MNITSEGIALTNTPLTWNPNEDVFYFNKQSRIFEKIAKRYGITLEELNLEFRRRVMILYKLYENRMFDFEKFQYIVNQYYKNPDSVLAQYGIK